VRKRTITVLAVAITVATAAFVGMATATTATCLNAQSLPGSAFEIDTNANLVVNSANCIDWLAGTAVSGPLRAGVITSEDLPSGQDDNSFVQGSKEDTTNPVIEFGGIPPNKSDLSWFGVYTEDDFLELFWSRVQDPSGTTNMDFELNQKFCDPSATPTNCSDNGVTPVRTGDGTGTGFDDLLITYDLSRGGTVATISIRKWTGTKWGPADTLDPTEARGTINTSTISQSPLVTAQNPNGSLSPRTFGEAAVSFDALFGPNSCGSFGSAYLKSRSSDSFTAALKDFVPPEQVNISNCPAGITSQQSFYPNDTATITGTGTLTGTVKFNLYRTQAACDADTTNVGTNSVYTESKTLNSAAPVTVSTTNNQTSTPSYKIEDGAKEGAYFWGVSYSGDANNDAARTCVEDSSVTINNT
jgi:hypothetical protein